MKSQNKNSMGGLPDNNRYAILIVEDEEEMRSYLREYLHECEGYTVYTASDGEEALREILPRLRIDLVLSDINMPRMKGFELLSAVRKQYPHIRRVLITAYNIEDYIDMALKHNVGNVLIKSVPIDTKELSVVVSSLLRCDIFGLNKYFDPETPSQTFLIRRGDFLEKEVVRIVGALPGHCRSRRLEIVLLEMLTNAIFYGIRRETALNRNEWEYDFELTTEEAIRVVVMYDSEKYAISVVDGGGCLKKTDVLYWLYRQLTTGDNQHPIGMYDTHGRGFFITRRYVDRVIINIERNKRTEIILMNYLKKTVGEYKPLYINEL